MPASYPDALRVQALTMLTMGYTCKDVAHMTKMSVRSLRYLQKKASDRGYDPSTDIRILIDYVQDGERTGRPKEISEETEEAILTSVSKDRNGREKSTEILAFEAGISHTSVEF